MERWLLRLQRYEFTVKFRAGKDCSSDYMSRHPYEKICSKKLYKEADLSELWVNLIAEINRPDAITNDEIITETCKNINLISLRLFTTKQFLVHFCLF